MIASSLNGAGLAPAALHHLRRRRAPVDSPRMPCAEESTGVNARIRALLRLADRGANGFPAERQMALDRALRYRAVMEWIRELMELAVGMRFQSSAHENPPTLRVIHRREARRSRNMLRDAPRRAGFHAPEV